MTAFRPCHNCMLERKPCDRRDAVKAAIKGAGITSVKFRCEQRQPLFAVGQRVSVTWVVPDPEGDYRYASQEIWPATVVAERRPKFQIKVDDVDSDHETPARDYIKNETLYAKVSAGKLEALDEPAIAVCTTCQAVADDFAGCFGYEDGPHSYRPRNCLKLAPKQP